MTKPMDMLTEELHARLFAFMLSRISNRQVAADLTQEALWCAERLLTQTDTEDVEASLCRAARNVVADYSFRSEPQMQWNGQAHAAGNHMNSPSPQESKLRRQLAVFIRGVVDALPEPYREALLLSDYMGLAQHEVCDRLGMNLLALMSRVECARIEVRRMIEGCCKIAAERPPAFFDYQPR